MPKIESPAQREAQERERKAREATDAFKIEKLADVLERMHEQMLIIDSRVRILNQRLDRLERAPFHED
jgi:hypothetical protein